MTTPTPGEYQQVPPMSPYDQRLWSTLIHIGGILFGFLPSLVGYLVLKDRGAFIRQHTAAALNFQLTMLIGYVVGFVLSIILIGFLLIAAVSVLIIVLCIIAAIESNNGKPYRYPLAIEFVR